MEIKRNKEIFLEEQEEYQKEALVLQLEQEAIEQEYWKQFKSEAIVEHTLTLHKTPEENEQENKLPF